MAIARAAPARRARALAACLCAALLCAACAVPPPSPEIADTPRPSRPPPAPRPGMCLGEGVPYTVLGQSYWIKPERAGTVQHGYASWYGGRFHGRRTASGERFDMFGMTAAHKTLPMFSRVEVTNRKNGRRTTVYINDRGPFVERRVIDLSYAAARRLRMIEDGVVPVRVRVLSAPPQSAPQ